VDAEGGEEGDGEEEQSCGRRESERLEGTVGRRMSGEERS
jgi:hypothetical protein